MELDRGDFSLAISRYCRIGLPRAFSGHEVQKLQNYLLGAWAQADGPARRGRGYDWVDLANKTGIAHERILAGRDVIVPILAAQERVPLDQARPGPPPNIVPEPKRRLPLIDPPFREARAPTHVKDMTAADTNPVMVNVSPGAIPRIGTADLASKKRDARARYLLACSVITVGLGFAEIMTREELV